MSLQYKVQIQITSEADTAQNSLLPSLYAIVSQLSLQNQGAPKCTEAAALAFPWLLFEEKSSSNQMKDIGVQIKKKTAPSRKTMY